MAIWQYTFQVLPKGSGVPISDDVFNRSDDGFDEELFWKMYPLKGYFFNKINSILKKNNSWSMDIDLYGNQESNCFEVLCDDKENVLAVSFRIDFRSNYEPILRHIIEFCSLNGLIIIDEGLNIVPWNYEEIQNIIKSSPQVKKYKELSEKNKRSE